MAIIDIENENAEKQVKNQCTYDWLKGYQFVKGQSGNPGGRPKGKSLKTFAREYLLSLPDSEKVAYLSTLSAEIVWKMAEGNPQSDVTTGGEPIKYIAVPTELIDKNKIGKETK